jgi:hypothetical protein
VEAGVAEVVEEAAAELELAVEELERAAVVELVAVEELELVAAQAVGVRAAVAPRLIG